MPTLGLLTAVTAFLLPPLMLELELPPTPELELDLIESVRVSRVFEAEEESERDDPFELSVRFTLSTRRRPSVGLLGSRAVFGW